MVLSTVADGALIWMGAAAEGVEGADAFGVTRGFEGVLGDGSGASSEMSSSGSAFLIGPAKRRVKLRPKIQRRRRVRKASPALMGLNARIRKMSQSRILITIGVRMTSPSGAKRLVMRRKPPNTSSPFTMSR